MNALELFNSGDLQNALAAAKQSVRDAPGDAEARSMLCQMFCFQNDWERADKQLEILGQQHSQMLVGVSLLRQLVRAEISRREFFAEGALPEVVSTPGEYMNLQMKALLEFREGNRAAACEALKQAVESAPGFSGKVNGEPFEGGQDLDDLVGGFFEILTTNGKYYFLPMTMVESIEFREPSRMQDQIWRSATIEVSDGPNGEVYFPVTYFRDPAFATNVDDASILGRKTDWVGPDDDLVRGLGQKEFLFGDNVYSIMELKKLEIGAQA